MQHNNKNNNIFSNVLIDWYLSNKRELLWRHTTDAYAIWLSEIILQQTKVAQGTPYYIAFLEAFPTIQDLATADIDRVLKLWEGLGYYSRARNLHATAKYITEVLHGVFPTTYKDLLTLKGVGTYTAAAVASFAYNESVAVVDGNVYRVLARIFGIDTPIDSTIGKKEFQLLANDLLHQHKPGLHNQAMMEFGALFCIPTKPDCQSCIFNKQCVAFQNNTVNLLPIKSKKTQIKDRYFNYFVVEKEEGQVGIQKRQEKDIWQGLYEFPLVEADALFTNEEAIQYLSTTTDITSLVSGITMKVHILSHQRIHSRFFSISNVVATTKAENWIWVAVTDLHSYAFPRLITNFLEKVAEYKKTLF